MNKTLAVVKRPSRSRRWIALAAAYSAAAMAVGLAINLPASAQATRPGAATPANQAAAEQQFQKAKALYDSGKFADARTENEKALSLDPTHANALLLRRVLAGKVSFTPALTTTQPSGTTPVVHNNVLNAQQISLVRLNEWSANDRNLRGKIDRTVLEDFWRDVIVKDPTANQSQQAHDAFVNPVNFAAQAGRIKDSGDSKYISQIQVLSDPSTLTFFRTNIQPYMLQTCATAECHGSEKGGNFKLITAAGAGPNAITAEQQLYTNFYIMAMYVGADGGRMIDRDTAERSLFLQYDIPKTNATFPHPKVDVPRKMAPGDARFRTMNDWVRALAFPKPAYGIAFEVPGAGSPTTAPASQPTTSTRPAAK